MWRDFWLFVLCLNLVGAAVMTVCSLSFRWVTRRYGQETAGVAVLAALSVGLGWLYDQTLAGLAIGSFFLLVGLNATRWRPALEQRRQRQRHTPQD